MIDIKAIWNGHVKTSENIIKTRIEEVNNFECFAVTNHITSSHLFSIKLSNETRIPNLNANRFKGVAIDVLEVGSHKELLIVLLDNQLKGIFSLFIENILDEIIHCVVENDAILNIINVITRWKKLFDKINFTGLSDEGQKGLLGELLLFKQLLKEGVPFQRILKSWTGPDYDDKDYRFGSKGFEVKLTAAKNPCIKITSERQLDVGNLDNLYLILYIVEQVQDKGFSLVQLITEIRELIKLNHQDLSDFNDRLVIVGYSNDDFEFYDTKYAMRGTNTYLVNDAFPKVTTHNVASGIYNVNYRIELSACGANIIGDNLIDLIDG